MSFQVARQAGALGAYITGIDLDAGVDDATFEKLGDAFLEHHVICFRGQTLSPAQHLEFSARWGDIFVHPYVESIEGHPGIMEVGDPHPITVTWHSDSTHAKAPPRMSLLFARELPAFGGDTMFASQHAAFDALSPALANLLEGLRAVHKGTELAAQGGLTRQEVSSTHPVVRRHPVNGRKALYVNADYTKHFEGMTEEESAPLLAYLYAHACRPAFTWRHHWELGDLLIWDNASVQHAVVPDVASGERLLHRVTVEGDVPV